MKKLHGTRLWISALVAAGLLLCPRVDSLIAQTAGQASHETNTSQRSAQLAHAAKLAEAGRYAAAMAIYRQLFGAHPPAGDATLAYYETEAAIDAGRPHAVAGLRALAGQYPSDPRYPIALGKVLTYDPATREEGRAYLAKYPEYPQALQALRQSLLWDAANPAAAPVIRAYLAAHPDAQLASVFESAQPGAAKQEIAEAPKDAVNAGTTSGPIIVSSDVVPAASSGAQVPVSQPANAPLAEPKAPPPAETHIAPTARESAGKEVGSQPGNADLSHAQEASAAQDTAESLLRKVIEEEGRSGHKPTQEVEMQLANLYMERGSPQLAYPIFQQVLRENPEHVDAWAGLLRALHETGHDREVVAQVALIPATVRQELDTKQMYRETMAAANGRLREQAAESAPPMQADAGQHNEASDIEIQRAWQLYNEAEDAALYGELMKLGARIDLTVEQRSGVQTIWVNWAVRRADQALSLGNQRRAVAILVAAERAFPENQRAVRVLAGAYMRAGEPHRAVLIYKAQSMASASANEYEAAVSAALADGDTKDAEVWLRQGLAAFPGDPQMLMLGARFEQARGDTAKATEYYRSSLKALPPVVGSKLTPESGKWMGASPTTPANAVQPRELAMLLAPGSIEIPEPGEKAYVPDGPGTSANVVRRDSAGLMRGGDVPAEAHAAGKAQADSAKTGTSVPSSASGEVYRSYIPYVPPVHRAQEASRHSETRGAVDALPTSRYDRSTRTDAAATSHDQAAGDRAERIRRQRPSAAEERSGQSHPPPEETITVGQDAQSGGAQIPRPASPPAGYGAPPDSGAQQYPQPRTRPGSRSSGTGRGQHGASAPPV